MKETLCNECKQTVPYHKTSTYKDKEYCNICIQKYRDNIPGYPYTVKRNYDSSVCHYCKAEADNISHKIFNGLPTCDNCEKSYVAKKPPIPVVLLFLAIFGLFIYGLPRNLNISSTTDLVKRADTALRTSNIETALTLSAEAIASGSELKVAYFVNEIASAYQLFEERDYVNAVEQLEKMRDKYRYNNDITKLLYISNGFLAFEEKDYEKMYENLRRAQVWLGNDYGDILFAQAAACMYVDTGMTEYSREAKDLIASVNRSKKPNNLDRIQHVQYILDSKQIISAEEYEQQLSEGNTGGAE